MEVKFDKGLALVNYDDEKTSPELICKALDDKSKNRYTAKPPK